MGTAMLKCSALLAILWITFLLSICYSARLAESTSASINEHFSNRPELGVLLQDILSGREKSTPCITRILLEFAGSGSQGCLQFAELVNQPFYPGDLSVSGNSTFESHMNFPSSSVEYLAGSRESASEDEYIDSKELLSIEETSYLRKFSAED